MTPTTDPTGATTGAAFSQTPPLEPIRTSRRVRFLEDEQLDRLQEATLHVLETVGVRFPNQRSLEILADHGAQVDAVTQIVRFPRDLVRKAMAAAPRSFTMAARNPAFDLVIQEGTSYYTTDARGRCPDR
jgi:trimethylamine--corrinoid protein Co-methyltransferase